MTYDASVFSFVRKNNGPLNNGPLNIALIGCSGGIGQALLNEINCEKESHTVYCFSRSGFDTSPSDKTALSQKTGPIIVQITMDITSEESVINAADIVAKQGSKLDVIIVSTGFLHEKLYDGLGVQLGLQPEKSLRQLTSENFLKNMAVNALGPMLVAKHFLPLMNRQSLSLFGALSARVGSISDNHLGGWYSYRASKAALNMLIKSLAIECKRKLPKAIVVGLHPGTVDTELSAPFQKNVPAEKLFTAEYSAKRLLSVIDGLTLADTGHCFAWDGKKIPA